MTQLIDVTLCQLAAQEARGFHEHAAHCAALASAGADAASAKQRREQALNWLRAELEFCRKRARDGPATSQTIRAQLGRWKQEPAFVLLRDAAALTWWPEAERAAWQRFWEEVDRLLADLPPPPPAGKPGPAGKSP
jgi:hypothetical protein